MYQDAGSVFVLVMFVLFCVCFYYLFSEAAREDRARRPSKAQLQEHYAEEKRQEAEEKRQEAEDLERKRRAQDLNEALAIMKNKLVGEWQVVTAGMTTEELILILDNSFVWTHGIDREVKSGEYEITIPEGSLPQFTGPVRRQADQISQCAIRLVDRQGVDMVVAAKLIPDNKLLISLPDKEELFTKKQ